MKLKPQLDYERKCREMLHNKVKGGYVIRIAGSGSQDDAVCDLILLTLLHKYLIEVKATKEIKYCFYGEQRQRLIEVAQRINAIPILAVRFKRRNWRFFNLLTTSSMTVRTTDADFLEEII